jgi:hypothetical protein
MELIITKLRKNSSEEIRISLAEYSGKTRLDVRIFFRSADVPQPKATRKGISLELRQVPSLIAALRRFQKGNASTTEVVPKNKSDEIHIYSASFAERQLVHIRTFYREGVDAIPKPSPRGVAFDESLLPQVIAGIERAEVESANLE